MNILASRIREAAEPLTGSPRDYDALLDRVGDAHLDLLGEVEETFPTGL